MVSAGDDFIAQPYAPRGRGPGSAGRRVLERLLWGGPPCAETRWR